MLQHPTSFIVLKLLHMILMEFTQEKGLSGRNNVLCVKNEKGNLIYDFGLGEMSDKMLEYYVQQR